MDEEKRVELAEFEKAIEWASRNMPPLDVTQPENILRPSPEQTWAEVLQLKRRMDRMERWAVGQGASIGVSFPVTRRDSSGQMGG